MRNFSHINSKVKRSSLATLLTLILIVAGCADGPVGPEADIPISEELQKVPERMQQKVFGDSVESRLHLKANSYGPGDVVVRNPSNGRSYADRVPVDVRFETGAVYPPSFLNCLFYRWTRLVAVSREGSSSTTYLYSELDSWSGSGESYTDSYYGNYTPPRTGNYTLTAVSRVEGSCVFPYAEPSADDQVGPAVAQSNSDYYLIGEHTETVNFTVSSVPLRVRINGPTYLQLRQSARFSTTTQGGEGDRSYEWRTRYYANGYPGQWSGVLSTGSSTYASVNSCGISDFELKVDVTDASGNTSTDTHFVDITNPC